MVGAAILLVVLGVGLGFVVWFQSLNVAGCGPDNPCDFDLVTTSVYITPIAGIAASVVTMVLAAILGLNERPMWWAPAIGTVIVIVAFVIAMAVNYNALGPILG